jgi:transposase
VQWRDAAIRLRKLGETVSKTIECEPRRWKIVEHVREKFSCRDCEAITEPPAPSRPIPRGLAGPSLLAVSKFLLHLRLNRQSEAYARDTNSWRGRGRSLNRRVLRRRFRRALTWR